MERRHNGARLLPGKETWLGWLVLLALVLAWEVIARAEWLTPFLFPTVTAILRSLYKLTVDGTIPGHMASSLGNMFAGYFAAALFAVPAGIAIGYSRRMRNLFLPLIEFIRPLPDTAIIPLAMLFLGVGAIEKIFIIGFSCGRILIINAMYGAQSVDPRLLDTARSYGYSGMKLVWRVVVPSALPQIFTGLRFSLALALIILIGAEILGSDKGIGYFTLLMQRTYSTPEMYACVLSLCVLGYFLNKMFLVTERQSMAWYIGLTRSTR